MDELTKVVLTASLTVVGGVTVLVIGQLLVKFVIEPVHELRKTIASIQYAFIFHDREIHTSVSGDKDRCDKAADTLRALAADLFSRADALPFYQLLAKVSFGALPQRGGARRAAVALRGLSNSVHQSDRSKNADRVAQITRLLGFEPVE